MTKLSRIFLATAGLVLMIVGGATIFYAQIFAQPGRQETTGNFSSRYSPPTNVQPNINRSFMSVILGEIG